MICCGSKIPKVTNEKGLLDEIRKVDNLDINLRLGNYDCQLKANGVWRTNVKGKPSNQQDELLQQSNELKDLIKERNEEIEILEKKYLAKIARLFIMAQVHCELKLNISELMKSIKPSAIALQDYNKSVNN